MNINLEEIPGDDGFTTSLKITAKTDLQALEMADKWCEDNNSILLGKPVPAPSLEDGGSGIYFVEVTPDEIIIKNGSK